MSKLQIGDRAPDFTLPASTGGEVSLGDFRGRYVVLYFYPKDDTPGCTREACDFRDHSAEFQGLDAVILGVSPDPLTAHARFIDKYGLPFTLLADTETRVCQLYGVWGEKQNYGRTYMGVTRSTFVIDPEGRIARAEYGVKVDGHVADVLDFVRQRKAG